MKQTSEDICTVCYEVDIAKIKFFHCSKPHNLCLGCLNNMKKLNKSVVKCPQCGADMCAEFKNPGLLTKSELALIDLKKINMKDVFIHQNFALDNNSKLMDIVINNKKITLYSLHGTLSMYAGMFICNNGFLYKYNEDADEYHVSVQQGKYQFWDMSRICISKLNDY